MKKSELKRRIEDGFSELAPDMFEAVMEASEKEQRILQAVYSDVCAEEEQKKSFFGLEYRNLRRYAVSACAGVVLFCLCVIGLMGNSGENIYLVMDINPSIQIVADESCQVKSLRGLNQDGEAVVKNLEKQKDISVYEMLEMLLQEAAAEAYLHEDSGILVTISTADRNVYEDLENKLGERVDRTLSKLGISGVTTAFRQEEGRSEEAGRKLLEEGIAQQYDVEAEKLQEMSVRELIQYCEEHPAMGLKISEGLEKERNGNSREEKEKEQRMTEATQPIEKIQSESQTNKEQDTKTKEGVVLEETQPEANIFTQQGGMRSENKEQFQNKANAGSSVQKDFITDSESEESPSHTESTGKNKDKDKKKEKNNAKKSKDQNSSSKKDSNGNAKNKEKDKSVSGAGGDKSKDNKSNKNESGNGNNSSEGKGGNNQGKSNDNVGNDINKSADSDRESKGKDKK